LGWGRFGLSKTALWQKNILLMPAKALWEQIATAMPRFRRALMFASANEPNADNAEQMNVLLSYHKTLLMLSVQPAAATHICTFGVTGTYGIISNRKTSADPTPNRLAFEWHNYTPSSFTIFTMTVLKYSSRLGRCAFLLGRRELSSIEPGRNCTYGFESDLLAGYNQIKNTFHRQRDSLPYGEYSAQRWTATRNKFVPREMDKHNKSVDDGLLLTRSNVKRLALPRFIGKQAESLIGYTNVVLDQRSLMPLSQAVNNSKSCFLNI
jgi:hypothetical protein